TLTAEGVEDVPQQDLVSGGRGKAGTAGHSAAGVGAEALGGKACIGNSLGNAPDEGGGGVFLLGMNFQVVQVNGQFRITFADHLGHLALGGDHAGQNIHVYAAGQNAAVLMVGMVSANLGTAGTAEYGGAGAVHSGEGFLKAPDHMTYLFPGSFQLLLGIVEHIQPAQAVIIFSLVYGLQKFFHVLHYIFLPFFQCSALTGEAILNLMLPEL